MPEQSRIPDLESAKARYFRLICERLGTKPDSKGKIYIPCPQCGKGDKHFGISLLGCFCFKCGYKPMFKELLVALSGNLPEHVFVETKKTKKASWIDIADDLAESFTWATDLVDAWQAYKPVPEKVIVERMLGYGVFPGLWYSNGQGKPDWVDPQGGRHWKCNHSRLIVPLLCQGSVVGFRCRSTKCNCPRWLSPSGSKLVLYNGGRISQPDLDNRVGDTVGEMDTDEVWILENPIDAILNEHFMGLATVATLGVSIWKQNWTEALARRKPKLVVVGYDHDASGNAIGESVRLDWKSKHPGFPMPMRGNKLHMSFVKKKINSVMYPWVDSDPIGEDLGDLFMGTPDQTKKLAMFFVRNILGREWITADFRGPVMKHAKSLLEHYDADTIAGCLEAIRDGIIGDGSFEIKYMSAIESTGEPPFIAQWQAYCETEPAVYMTQTHIEWLERKDKVYPELLPDPKPDVPAKPPRPRRKKSATQLTIGSI